MSARPPLPHFLPFFLADLSILQTISHLGLKVPFLFHPWKLPLLGLAAWPCQKALLSERPPPRVQTPRFSFLTTTSRPLLASCRELVMRWAPPRMEQGVHVFPRMWGLAIKQR